MKKISVLLFCVIFCLLGSTACSFGSRDFDYNTFDNGDAEITRYYGKDLDLVIPEKLGKHSVISIGEGAFSGCSSLISVTIPDGVTSIGEGAFTGCSSLTSVAIPDSVTSIGKSAFQGCSSLTSVTFPDSVTSIGERAFYGCSSLTSVTIPDSVTSIGESAFTDCKNSLIFTVNEKSYAGRHLRHGLYHYSFSYAQFHLSELNDNPDVVIPANGQKIVVYNEDSRKYEKSEYIPFSMQADSVEEIGYVFSWSFHYLKPRTVRYDNIDVAVSCEEMVVKVIEPGTGRVIAEKSSSASPPFMIRYSGSPPDTYSQHLDRGTIKELMQKICEKVGIEWID